ncbi:MAG: hypothetical protein ABW040_01780 [Microbacteriaceae bacterium]
MPRILGFLVAVAIPFIGLAWLRMLRDRGDDSFLWGVVVLGALVPLLALIMPILVTRRDPLHPRAFVVYGYRPPAVAVLLAVLGVLSLPSLVLAIFLVGFVQIWSLDGRSFGPAVAAAIGIYLISSALVLIGRTIGATASRTRWAATVRLIAAAILLGVGVRVLPAFIGDPRYFYGRFADLGAALEGTVFAWLPLHPRRAATGEALPDMLTVLLALGVAVLLWLGWSAWVARSMSGRSGNRMRKRRASIGWFGILPSTPAGAVAARSITYWLRDPRYAASFPILPLIPIAMLVATWIGGIPFELAVLVPLPTMVAVLAWATVHNDVAYDSTAVWSHIVADIRGADDRFGRIVPALVVGLVMIAIGAPLTALGHGDFGVLPTVLGCSAALLLGALGISSAVSARYPYPAPRPGDGAFSTPQAVFGSPGKTQTYSFLGVLLVALPAMITGALWLVEGGMWNWASLALGVVLGVSVLSIGIRVGGRSFERRGPDLLAFTVRN